MKQKYSLSIGILLMTFFWAFSALAGGGGLFDEPEESPRESSRDQRARTGSIGNRGGYSDEDIRFDRSSDKPKSDSYRHGLVGDVLDSGTMPRTLPKTLAPNTSYLLGDVLYQGAAPKTQQERPIAAPIPIPPRVADVYIHSLSSPEFINYPEADQIRVISYTVLFKNLSEAEENEMIASLMRSLRLGSPAVQTEALKALSVQLQTEKKSIQQAFLIFAESSLEGKSSQNKAKIFQLLKGISTANLSTWSKRNEILLHLAFGGVKYDETTQRLASETLKAIVAEPNVFVQNAFLFELRKSIPAITTKSELKTLIQLVNAIEPENSFSQQVKEEILNWSRRAVNSSGFVAGFCKNALE